MARQLRRVVPVEYVRGEPQYRDLIAALPVHAQQLRSDRMYETTMNGADDICYLEDFKLMPSAAVECVDRHTGKVEVRRLFLDGDFGYYVPEAKI